MKISVYLPVLQVQNLILVNLVLEGHLYAALPLDIRYILERV